MMTMITNSVTRAARLSTGLELVLEQAEVSRLQEPRIEVSLVKG